MANFFTSSIGKKIMMAGLGLFLIVFLLVHLGINLLLVIFESRDPFNIAAHFMATNIVIKVFEVFLFGGFLLHMIYGVWVQIQNWISRPIGYAKSNNQQTSFFSKYMIHTAVIIGVFLVIHLLDFYLKAKIFGGVPEVEIHGKQYHDLGLLVVEKFQIGWVVIFYIASFLFLGFHLLHGFQSAFQTFGLNYKTLTPIVKACGVIYTVLVVAGFVTIPLIIYFS
ncbi:MAG: succinate dehydrogenase cytochrome b subunit [Bacteroidales bacterium]|nr:succinate dehydrogenase cytochrome b subunit [Bacteroidales bacterium]MCB8998749.1 succinate dehydrogenase cytochrome b subunit [Bacteroidales bacterium]